MNKIIIRRVWVYGRHMWTVTHPECHGYGTSWGTASTVYASTVAYAERHARAVHGVTLAGKVVGS